MGRRKLFIVRVDDGGAIQPFKGASIEEIISMMEEKYIQRQRRRR